MDIGTIIAAINAIGSIAQAMNQAPQMTPAQAEQKEKKQGVQQPTVVVLPNQTPPMGIMPPPPPPPSPPPRMPSSASYWDTLPPANVLRTPIWRVPQYDIRMPVFRGVPLTTHFPDFRPEPSLEELYQLYFGTRF